LLPGHVGTGLLEMYAEVVETGEPLILDDYVYPQELMAGEERHYDIRAARVGDGLTYTWRDVTEGHQQALHDRRMAVIVEQSKDAIIGTSVEVIGIVTFHRDITERVRAADKEKQRLAELEQFQRLAVGRELKMIELKKEIEYLKKHGSAGGGGPGDDFET